MKTPPRVLAVAAVPMLLLIGSATPAPAADTFRAPASASPTCRVPAPDEVITAQESIQRVKQCSAGKAAALSWHWMGNYGNVYDIQNVANQLGVRAGGLVTQVNPSGNGLFPTFMYY